MLDGKTEGDKTGEFTYLGGGDGSSVIDLCCVAFSTLDVMTILVLQESFSDHILISVEIF